MMEMSKIRINGRGYQLADNLAFLFFCQFDFYKYIQNWDFNICNDKPAAKMIYFVQFDEISNSWQPKPLTNKPKKQTTSEACIHTI